jgi:radical SAM protein with 4Fe4S-binding SPASM domain
MSTDEIRRLIDCLQRETPVETIALSGGEPLLRNDLPEIAGILKERGINPVIISNGRLLTAEKVESLRDARTFEVTLFSYRPEVHNELAGSPHAWDRAIDAMVNLRNAGRDFVVVFVATRQNCKDLEKTVELAIAVGAYGLMYNRVNLSAYNLPFADRLLPTPEMIRENLQTLDEIGGKYKFSVAVSVVVEPCVVDTRPYRNIHFGWCPLAGENAYFTIDPTGNVRICNHSPVVLGNVKEGGFAEIYRNHPHVQAFRSTWPVECESCDPELRSICNGGCKAAAEQCYGTLSRVDPFVTINRTPHRLAAD